MKPALSFTRDYKVFAVAAIATILLFLFGYIGLILKERAAREIYRETTNSARFLLSHFEEQAANIDARLQQLCRYFENVDLNDERLVDKERELSDFVRYFAGPSAIFGPAVFNKHGLAVASGRYFPAPKLFMADQQSFRVHADNPRESKLYISPSLIGRLSKEWVIQFTRPLHDKAGDFAGVVLIAYKLSNLTALYEKLHLTEHGLMALNGIDGVTRIRIADGKIEYQSKAPPQGLVMPRVRSGELEGTAYGRTGRDGSMRIGSFVASRNIPFYVFAAYGDEYFMRQYLGDWFVLALVWLAIIGASLISIHYGTRLARAHQQSEVKVAYLSGLAASAERQKILADLHDSIGANLTALLSAAGQRSIDAARLKQLISETLTELRLLVDTTHGEGGDINLILAGVRHRMASAIGQAGIELHWKVDEIPKRPDLSVRDEFALKLIMLEAISNALHHAKAKNLTVTVSRDERSAASVVTIQDDGCGFDLSDKNVNRYGLNNMQKRANAIRAILSIQSAPESGTTVRLVLPALNQDAASA